jgi:hypothetical protein
MFLVLPHLAGHTDRLPGEELEQIGLGWLDRHIEVIRYQDPARRLLHIQIMPNLRAKRKGLTPAGAGCPLCLPNVPRDSLKAEVTSDVNHVQLPAFK